MNSYAQTLMLVCMHGCVITQMITKQSYFPVGESISISIDQQSCYHVALTWESISHLGCPASLGFHGQRQDKDTRKVYYPISLNIPNYWYAKLLAPHVPHTWKVWFMGLFCIGRHLLQSRRCQEHCSNSPLTNTWQESTENQRRLPTTWEMFTNHT